MYEVDAKLYDYKNSEIYSNVEHFNEYKYEDALKNFNKQFKRIKMICKNLFKLMHPENDQTFFTISIKINDNSKLIKEYNGKWHYYMFNNGKRFIKCDFDEYSFIDGIWIKIDSYTNEYNY